MYEAADMNGAPLRALFTGVSPVNTSIICVIAREGLGGHYRPSIRSGNLIWPDVGGAAFTGEFMSNPHEKNNNATRKWKVEVN
jgi:hypothetical protein